MKRKTPAKTLLVVAFLGLAISALAQTTTAPVATTRQDPGYGLLGEEYSGVQATYIDNDKGPHSVLHRYSFVASRPAATNVDAGFRYDYTRGSVSGVRSWQHAVSAGATGYLPFAGFKPFVEGNVGWAFQETNGSSDNAFMFLVAGGAEFQVCPRLVVTPYVSYKEIPDFSTRVWNYGAKATFRILREWSATAGVQVDKHNSFEYLLGVNRHF